MRWAAAHSVDPVASAAADEVGTALKSALGPEAPDLAMVFLSPVHVEAGAEIARTLSAALGSSCLIGASAHGVISDHREIESGPAVTAIAARLPGVDITPFILVRDSWLRAAEDPAEFARCAPGVQDAEVVILFADPFSLPVDHVLEGFRRFAPGIRVVGGMASAGVKPGSNTLILNDWLAREGGVALALSGAVRADVIVSQGCHPIGPPLEVTRAEGNVLVELDGQPALERAEQVLLELSEQDRERLRNGLYVGRPVRTGASGAGDYLVRNLLGADRDRGLIAIADHAVQRERIRLHVRDADVAREDLELLLSPQAFDSRAAAAMLFACNGRGSGLFGRTDVDVTTLQSALGGGVPIAGMFCAGEIGPVGDRNYVHGHSAGIVVLRPK